ncbi:MAG: GNAT family N-acetyltransferase, partial [Mycobacteriales bacterium]
VYAAFYGDEAVGLACGWLPEDTPDVTDLISMWVAPKARGRRIVGMLIDAIAGWARERETTMRLEVLASNRIARRSYARQGFTVDDRPARTDGAVALRFTPIRPAGSADFALLPAIEAAADTLFGATGIGPLPPPSTSGELAAARVLLVVGDPPVGFARIEELDGAAHLEQLSVHPDRARRGIGTALLAGALDWATESGYPTATLITFADVACNAPFYARNGFVGVTDGDLSAGLRRLRQREVALGLDALGTRVVMRKPLSHSFTRDFVVSAIWEDRESR